MKEETQKSGQLEMFWRSFLDFERENFFFHSVDSSAKTEKQEMQDSFLVDAA